MLSTLQTSQTANYSQASGGKNSSEALKVIWRYKSWNEFYSTQSKISSALREAINSSYMFCENSNMTSMKLILYENFAEVHSGTEFKIK